MTFGRPVTCLASLTAASVISAPELAKKNVSMRPGASSASRVANGSSRSWVNTLAWRWMPRAACRAIASTTSG